MERKEETSPVGSIAPLIINADHEGLHLLNQVRIHKITFMDSSAFLEPQEISVKTYTFFNGIEPDRLEHLKSLLSSEEISRCKQITHTPTRTTFILSRYLLRTQLAMLTGWPPEAIRYNYNPCGKPSLKPTTASPENPDRIHFNLSHSGKAIALAFSKTCAVGVDIQLHNTKKALRNLASRYFSSQEQKKLFGISDPSQFVQFFYTAWTQKEAYIKAIGTGLRTPLNSFSIEPDNISPFSPFLHDSTSASGSEYTVQSIREVPSDYALAICWKGRSQTIKTSVIAAETVLS